MGLFIISRVSVSVIRHTTRLLQYQLYVSLVLSFFHTHFPHSKNLSLIDLCVCVAARLHHVWHKSRQIRDLFHHLFLRQHDASLTLWVLNCVQLTTQLTGFTQNRNLQISLQYQITLGQLLFWCDNLTVAF